MSTCDRAVAQMKTREEEGPVARGPGDMGHQTTVHLAQGCCPLRQGKKPQPFARSKVVWFGNSVVAENHEIPTGKQRECGAGGGRVDR